MTIDPITAKVSEAALSALVKGTLTSALGGLKSLKAPIVDAFVNRFSTYIDKQYELHKYLRTLVFENPRLLEDLYIPLTVMPAEEGNPDGPTKTIKLTRFHDTFLPNHKRVLITDTAGMGKSTLMKFLFIQCFKSNYAIPIFIELRLLSSNQTIFSTIERELNFDIPKDSEEYFNKTRIQRILKKGGLVFFFDGYDEIPFKFREEVTRDINEIIANYPKNIFAVTSRPESGLAAFSGFKHFKIKPLQRDESFALIKKYDNDGSRSKLLLEKLNGDGFSSVKDFLKNPLLTTLLYRSFEYKQSLPLKKHAFYRLVFEALYDWHDATKDGYNTREKRSKLDRDGFDRILRIIGIICVTSSTFEGDQDIVLGWVRTAKESCPGLSFPESEFLDDLIKAVPLFVKEGLSYQWAHKSIAEYFAAQYICTEGKNEQAEILSTILNEGKGDRFRNVLDQLYDIDLAAFRKYLIAPLAKDFEQYWNGDQQTMHPEIPAELVNLRRATVFSSAFAIGKRFGDIEILTDKLQALCKYPIPNWAPRSSVYFRFFSKKNSTDSSPIQPSFIVAMLPGKYEAILSILKSKKDPLILSSTKIDFSKFSKSKSVQRKITGLRATAEMIPLSDSPDDLFNLPKNFAVATEGIASLGTVVDADKMISFSRECDSEPDKLMKLTQKLLSGLKNGTSKHLE